MLSDKIIYMDRSKTAFRWIVDILQKHDVPFMVTGGLAARAYGSQRDLRDIDLEVPDDQIGKIIEDVSRYIVFGPERYRDDFFDLALLRLNYEGQEIDISGGSEVKIYDPKKEEWVNDPTDFSKYESKEIFGAIVLVVQPEDWLVYKSISPRREDLQDIEAVKRYMTESQNVGVV